MLSNSVVTTQQVEFNKVTASFFTSTMRANGTRKRRGGGRRIKVLTVIIYICLSLGQIYKSSIDQRGSKVPISLQRMNYEGDSRKCKLINWNSGPEVLWVHEGFERES